MHSRQRPPARRIAFISSNEAWGGSEELWSRAATELARAGAEVSAYKQQVNRAKVPVAALREAGCRVFELLAPRWAPRKARTLVGSIWKISRYLQDAMLTRDFKRRRPDLVVISQGLNYDGWYLGVTCRRLGIPYVLISQKASDLYWPPDGIRDELSAVYRDAAAALFVSAHNRQLTEEQLGFALPRARVVRNPFKADWGVNPPWPDESDGFRLACLARLDAREKGQDLLLRVLAMPKWRVRDLTVRLYGSGHNEFGLRAMAAMLDVPKVEFSGFVDSPAAIWLDVHGLILPSRCEGLPLSLVEAMLHGRVAIVTDVGGNREALVDGITGFLAEAATEGALDAALERAWQRRSDWREMGAAGVAHARSLVTVDPAKSLVEILLDLKPGDVSAAGVDHSSDLNGRHSTGAS